MRKIAIGLGILVGIAILATPLAGGLLAKRAHELLVQNFDQVEVSSNGFVRVVNDGFSLGWLSSDARMRIELGIPGESLAFTLLNVIHHGPLPVRRMARGFSVAVIDTSVEGATTIDGDDAFRGETVIGFTGDVGVDFTSLALPRRDNLAWDGGALSLRVGGQGNRIAAQANAPHLELRGPPGELGVDELKVDYTSERAASGASLGTASYALGRLRLTATEDDRRAALERFSWSSKSALNAAGKLDTTVTLRIAALDVDDQTYRNVTLEGALRNLDDAAVKALTELQSRLAQALRGASGPTLSDYPVELGAILASQPQLELKGGRVETLDGPIDLELRAEAAPGAGASAGTAALQVQGRVVLPLPLFATLAQRAAGQVSPAAALQNDEPSLRIITDQIGELMLTQGYFTEESDGRLSTDVAYRDDQLSLNGKPFSMQELITRMGGPTLLGDPQPVDEPPQPYDPPYEPPPLDDPSMDAHQ